MVSTLNFGPSKPDEEHSSMRSFEQQVKELQDMLEVEQAASKAAALALKQVQDQLAAEQRADRAAALKALDGMDAAEEERQHDAEVIALANARIEALENELDATKSTVERQRDMKSKSVEELAQVCLDICMPGSR